MPRHPQREVVAPEVPRPPVFAGPEEPPALHLPGAAPAREHRVVERHDCAPDPGRDEFGLRVENEPGNRRVRVARWGLHLRQSSSRCGGQDPPTTTTRSSRFARRMTAPTTTAPAIANSPAELWRLVPLQSCATAGL